MVRRVLGKLRKPWIVVVVLGATLMSVQSVMAHPSGTWHFTNVRRVVNHHSNTLRVRGRVQLNRPGTHTAVLDDEAWAYSSCTGCQSLAVALQVNFVSPKAASNDLFTTTAVAENYKCTGCTTVAVAMQYDVISNDWRHVPDTVSDLVHTMNRELDRLSDDPDDFTLNQAIARIQAVIAQFQSLPTPPTSGAAPHAAAPHAAAPTAPPLRVEWSTATDYTTPGAPASPSE